MIKLRQDKKLQHSSDSFRNYSFFKNLESCNFYMGNFIYFEILIYNFLLADLYDFDLGVFLAMASFFMDAFLGFVANNANLVTLNFGRFDFG